MLLFIVVLVFGTSQVAAFWDAETRARWRQSWARLAAGLITAAVFFLGYRAGLDIANAHGLRGVSLFDQATGMGLICLAAFVYDASDADSRARARSLAEMLGFVTVLIVFLGAGTATGLAASRLLGPIGPTG